MFLSRVSKGEMVQPYLAINITGLVQFGKNLSYILPPLLPLRIVFVKLIYQFLNSKTYV